MNKDYQAFGKHLFGEPAVLSTTLAHGTYRSAMKTTGCNAPRFGSAVSKLGTIVHPVLTDIERQIEEIERERRDVYTLFLALRHTDMRPEYDRLGWIIPDDLRERLRNGNRTIHDAKASLRHVVELADASAHARFPGERPDAPVPDLLIDLPGCNVLPLEVRSAPAAGRFIEKNPEVIAEWTAAVSHKRYGDAPAEPSEFAILYPVPGLVWDAPLGVERVLVDRALQQDVILSGPITLYLILRLADYSLRLEDLARQASWVANAAQNLSSALQGKRES